MEGVEVLDVLEVDERYVCCHVIFFLYQLSCLLLYFLRHEKRGG